MGDMNPRPITRFYQVRVPRPDLGWARIWITDDGCFSTVSDYGNYGYWWGAPGCEFRKFLCGVDSHYLTTKLASGEKEYDDRGTLAAVKQFILGKRRARTWSAVKAREEWELLGKYSSLDSEHDLSQWATETKLPIYEEFGLVRYETPRQLAAFVERIGTGRF